MAGFTFHGAIHQTLPDAHCVMHVHTTATMAVYCLEEGLAYTNFYAAQLFGKVAYHDFEGITVHLEEGRRILQSAGAKPVLLLCDRQKRSVVPNPTLPHWRPLPLRWRRCGAQVFMAETVQRVEIRGRVQGVGYRWSMAEEARRLGIRGWVRNRGDGSVEALLTGPPEAVDRLVAWARRGPRSAVVATVDVFAADGAFDSFELWPTV